MLDGPSAPFLFSLSQSTTLPLTLPLRAKSKREPISDDDERANHVPSLTTYPRPQPWCPSKSHPIPSQIPEGQACTTRRSLLWGSGLPLGEIPILGAWKFFFEGWPMRGGNDEDSSGSDTGGGSGTAVLVGGQGSPPDGHDRASYTSMDTLRAHYTRTTELGGINSALVATDDRRV
ncbi:hypothetical protein B0T19DRAFT_47430 [Cercophora scortea]|uniref:Uncharacterized protein n=1 Tax=Cercophora scortea TaxID=314031 RepID=A0AAE0J4B2_9PEZI|nr:hypothetical protein B0T19DRAFT_47430 [Cercophora scortea]